MKKLLALLMVSLLVLFGCSATEASTTSSVEQIEDDEIIFLNGWSPNASDDDAYAEYMREYTGENVHWYMAPSDNGLEKLMLDLSTQVQYNLVNAGNLTTFNEVVSNGLAVDLRPYLEEYGQNILEEIPEWAWATVTDPETGAIYGIPSPVSQEKIDGMIYYRKDVLAEHNIEVPTTTDEFLDATCTLAAEGVKTPYGVNWSSALYDSGLLSAFSGGWWWNINDEGELEYLGMDENFYMYLDYMTEMYNCGGLGNDYETIQQEDRNTRFINGETVFIQANTWDQQMIAEGLAAQGIDYYDAVGILPPLTGPEGRAEVMASGNQVVGAWFIPSYMEQYAAQTIQIVNMTYEEEFVEYTRYGDESMEGVSYEVTEDGVKYPAPGYEQPEGELPNAYTSDYYMIGAQYDMFQESNAAKDAALAETVESGGEYTPGDWAIYESNKYLEEYGVFDPLGGATGLTLWNENRAAMETELQDFTNMYVTGAKTAEDIPAFQEQMESKYQYSAMKEEVNTWYTEYQASLE